MTCLDGYYLQPSESGYDYSSLAEALVRVPNAGAIASWSPTGLGVASGHDIMNKALYKAIFQDDIVELGAATMLGKLALVGQGHDELIDTYLLFGDPALHLNVLPADVRITKAVTPEGIVDPGDTLTYTLTYSNAGPATAHHVVISDSLPLGLAAPAITSTGAAITARVGSALVWDVADLVAGAGGVITVTATVAPPFTRTLVNRATIETSAVETDTTNNTTPPVVTPVRAPDLAITKRGPLQGKPGQVITYTLTYSNTGDALAPRVLITDVLPSGTTLYAHSGTLILPAPDNTMTWERYDLAPGDGGTLTVAVTISPTFAGWMTNTATIAMSLPELNLTNNESVVRTRVVLHKVYLPLVMKAFP